MPLVRNETNQPHCVSDLDITWFPKGHNLGADIHNLTKDMIANSMGIQKLVARNMLKVLTPKEIKEEAQRSADLAAKQAAGQAAPAEIVEESEVIHEANWVDPNITHEHPMPNANTGEFAGGVPLPSDTKSSPSAVVDLNQVTSDPTEAVGDLLTE